MPESAFASINIRFSQLPSGLWLITGYASFPFQHPVDILSVSIKQEQNKTHKISKLPMVMPTTNQP